MASRIRAVVLLTSLAVPAAALQVTPNSPCSEVCIDSPGLDTSDPNSSNTRGEDIVCADGQMDAGAAGAKFKTCLACLQTSTYTQGSEGDQAWFLYNLRFAVDHCVFGFPNASDVETSPCVTPESCGALAKALKSNVTRPSADSAFGYCDADDGAVTGMYFESCLECVQADGQHAYLANFLVALEAACLQKPPASLLVGVNETVFTHHTIAMTQPSPPAASSSSPPAPALSTPAIVGVAMAGVVVLALLAGCAYMQVRRRQNRINRARRTLSFRCKTAAAPAPVPPSQHQPQPYHDDDYDDERFFEKRPGSQDVSVASMSPVARSKPQPWPALSPSAAAAAAGPRALNMLHVTTDIPPPEPAYASPSTAGLSPDDLSPGSSAPLLSPARGTFPSPGLGLGPFARSPGGPGGPEPSTRASAGRRRGTPGSPVHTTRIQTTFDPPPTR